MYPGPSPSLKGTGDDDLLVKGVVDLEFSVGKKKITMKRVVVVEIPWNVISTYAQFKRNSLAVCASIRVVSGRGASSTSTPTSSTSTSVAQLPKQPKQVSEPKLDKIIEEENDVTAIQTVIILTEELTRHIFKRGWNTSSFGKRFIIMPESKTCLNPELVYSRADWPMRSTMFQRDDLSWELVEFCNSDFVYDSEDVEIDECSRPTFVLTMLHKREEPFSVLGAVSIRRLTDPWRSVWLFMVQEKPYQNLSNRQPSRT